MYDEQLEKLIEIALRDGELTEKERGVLIRKAASFGIDQDEIEMVIEDRLASMRPKAATPNKSNRTVSVRNFSKKCKECGAPRLSSASSCPDCGWKYPSPLQDLKESLELADEYAQLDAREEYNEAMVEYKNSKPQKSKDDKEIKSFWGIVNKVVSVLSDDEDNEPNEELIYYGKLDRYRDLAVNSFAIPNGKNDLLELLEYFHNNADELNSNVCVSKKMEILEAVKQQSSLLEKMKLKKYEKGN